MGYNKLDVTSTFEHEPIIELTDKMLVKAGRKVQKKGNTMIKINVIKYDLEKAAIEAENKRYDKILFLELCLITAVVLSAIILS
jgi:5-enolpyruvylshikimate-3-phosphate synthase